MTTTTPALTSRSVVSAHDAGRRRKRRIERGRTVRFHALMAPVTLLWAAPVLFALLVSVRSLDDIVTRGLGALPTSFRLDSFAEAWNAGVDRALLNSVVVTAPTVVLELLLGSMAAFALSRYHIPLRRVILAVMLAGNLLPPQVLLVPASRMMQSIGLYDSLLALIIVHTAFGVGFFTFVLHGFMRDVPEEVTEAARIDGAGAFTIYWRIMLPLVRPALAGLAALASTWAFNDLIWSLAVIRTGELFPISATMLSFNSQYLTSWNVATAGAILAALPTALVFFVFQKQFVSGMLMGSVK